MKNKPEINEVLTKFRVENPELFEKNDRVSCTPVKKRIATPTPLKHQFSKLRGLSDLNNLSVPSSTVSDNSKSVTSLSSASNSEIGSNFSPIIKKYMNELENTIIEKLHSFRILLNVQPGVVESYQLLKIQKMHPSKSLNFF
ncbi:hypothetical protein WA026_014620 [Henosepilachna vigintioctopunctata]|uniref:Uncharacterized protein n=1 Tax=Henosepilachna vigintioctopunctata TaxID=420089 RepID=A0AAW1VFL0_9CUCU